MFGKMSWLSDSMILRELCACVRYFIGCMLILYIKIKVTSYNDITDLSVKS